MSQLLKSLVLLVVIITPLAGQEFGILQPAQMKSTVIVGEFMTADKATLSPREDGRVDVFVSNLDDFSRFVATVDVPYKSPIVRAFEVNASGYRPVTLQPTKTPSKFTLDKPGEWTIEIFGVQDGVMKIDTLDGIVIPSSGMQPDPVKPDDPVAGPDLSALTELTVSTLKVVNDREKAGEYLMEIKALSFSGELSDMITKVSQIRRDLFVGPVKGQWYKFFQMIDDEFSEVKTLEGYKQHWDAVILGMEMYLTPSSNQISYLNQKAILPIPTFTFPRNPVPNQTYRGYQYRKTSCYNGTCTYGWVLAN